ncbi:hypothetical protein LIER_19400 [Lithospermum erythrorhizon]|uniref:Retrotransposon gag domain-containing protein n=1 Tax=Lithospermum erythrorhizon TaxID=34254 RepID=A0AAV3QIJ0_LITER
MSVEEYFGKLQPLWNELQNLTPLPSCSCGGLTDQLMTMRLEERYHDFIYGLNRELYGSVRSALNTQEPLPSLDTTYHKIREEESLRKASDTTVGDEFVAFSLRSNPRMGDYVDKSKLWCNHCKKQGHDSTTCFLIIGYPEWWETRNSRGARSGEATSTNRDGSSMGGDGSAATARGGTAQYVLG